MWRAVVVTNDSVGHESGFDVTPKGNRELASQGNQHGSPGPWRMTSGLAVDRDEPVLASLLPERLRHDLVVSSIFRTLVGGLLWLSGHGVALLEQLHVEISFS